MKRFLIGILILVAMVANGQVGKVYPTDSTGNVYVLFVRTDSIGVVYKAKLGAFVSDGIFANDYSGFDLKLHGFLKFDGIKANLSDFWAVQNTDNKKDSVVVLPATSGTVEMFKRAGLYGGQTRYFIEPTDWVHVNKIPEKITDMAGYDFAPIMANNYGNIWQYGAWEQEYVSVKGERDIWRDGNATYFLKPKGYSTDMNTQLMDFDLRFPDFKLPGGKYVIMQPTPLRDFEKYNYLKKGVSFAKNYNGDKGYVFVSDAWLTDLGCPGAYTSTQADFDAWCERVDGDDLLKSFVEKVYFPCKDYGYVMLNWEHVGTKWHVRKDKILRCLEWWATHEHKAKMALWTVSGIGMGRPIFQGSGLDFTDALNFNGSLAEFQAKYGMWVSIDFDYARFVDFGHIGGYQNYPVEDGVIHHYLFELLLHRKYNKEKKILATVWFDVELINNFDLGRVRVDYNGGSYLAQVKPKVSPSVAFNWGAWTVAVGDGFDCWSDPNYWDDKKEFWGWGATDLNGNDLPIKQGEHLSKYPSQPMKNIDWMMSGAWAVSENLDIVEWKSDWNFVKLPTKSFADKKVLIAYKVKNNVALVLALDGFGKIDGETVHSFEIGGKSYNVKTKGRFTSVVRLKL